VYADVAVYPEDTIFELRLKICLAAQVSPYRQHLFTYAGDEGPTLPYRLTLDGIPVPVNWRAAAVAPEHSDTASMVIAGPSLDPDPPALLARFTAERAIAERALGWHPAAARGPTRQGVSVTAACVRVAPLSVKMRVAVRNVFDLIAVLGEASKPAIAAARA